MKTYVAVWWNIEDSIVFVDVHEIQLRCGREVVESKVH